MVSDLACLGSSLWPVVLRSPGTTPHSRLLATLQTSPYDAHHRAFVEEIIATQDENRYTRKEKGAMTGLQNNSPCQVVSSHRPHFMSLVVVSALIPFAFVVSGCSGHPFPTADAASAMYV